MDSGDFICTDSTLSYRDIQSYSFFSQYKYTKDLVEFLRLLKVYEKIDRTELSYLPERVDLLTCLYESLPSDSLYLRAIRNNILSKKRQLVALQKLHKLSILRDKKELYNPEIEDFFDLKNKNLLPVKNDFIYDFDKNVMLGKYVLEALDPTHRTAMASYVREWENNVNNKSSFLLFLEQNCNFDLIPQIEYFSDEALSKCQIKIKDGLLYTHDNKLLTTTPDREYLFVLCKDNQFYGCYSDVIHKHTSMTKGQAIKCGGALKIDNGIIQEIYLDSGHYFPTLAHLNKLVYYLEKKNVKLNDDIKVLYHENFTRCSISLKKGLSR